MLPNRKKMLICASRRASMSVFFYLICCNAVALSRYSTNMEGLRSRSDGSCPFETQCFSLRWQEGEMLHQRDEEEEELHTSELLTWTHPLTWKSGSGSVVFIIIGLYIVPFKSLRISKIFIILQNIHISNECCSFQLYIQRIVKIKIKCIQFSTKKKQHISILEWFLKDHVTLKTGIMILKIQLWSQK